MMLKQKQVGLSLIELMISLTLGIVLMTGVIQMFMTSRLTYSTQQAISTIQESGRMAIDFLAEDIRMAGYMGCTSRNANIENGLQGNAAYMYNFDRAVEGYDADADLDGIDDVSADTDVLVIRRASSGSVHLVAQHNEGSNANLRIDEAPVDDCLFGGQLCDDSVAIISDCTQGRIFRAVNIQASAGGGGEGIVVHSNGGSAPTNVDPQLGGQSFGPGSEIMAFNSIAYYVADSNFQNGDVTVRSLWKRVGTNDPVELIEGVERMRVQFGVGEIVEIAGEDERRLDEYKWREDMAGDDDWANVMSVRVHLLLAGMSGNVLPEPQVITFAGEPLDEEDVADRRLRHVFTTTVGLRSRLD